MCVEKDQGDQQHLPLFQLHQMPKTSSASNVHTFEPLHTQCKVRSPNPSEFCFGRRAEKLLLCDPLLAYLLFQGALALNAVLFRSPAGARSKDEDENKSSDLLESVSEWAASRSRASTLLTKYSARALSLKETENVSLPRGFINAFCRIRETLPFSFRWQFLCRQVKL